MRKRTDGDGSRDRLTRAVTRPPFRDKSGNKGWFTKFSRARQHVVRHLNLEIAGWPRWSRPLRIAFLSDFHVGSHSDDIARLNLIIDEAASATPDLALFGGDYVNMQSFGGGRVPPQITAAILSRLEAPLGRFAVLGNHDYAYDERAVAGALQDHGIIALDHDRRSIQFQNRLIQIIGLPDAPVTEPKVIPCWLLSHLTSRLSCLLMIQFGLQTSLPVHTSPWPDTRTVGKFVYRVLGSSVMEAKHL